MEREREVGRSAVTKIPLYMNGRKMDENALALSGLLE
jgi:hypothetical protein